MILAQVRLPHPEHAASLARRVFRAAWPPANLVYQYKKWLDATRRIQETTRFAKVQKRTRHRLQAKKKEGDIKYIERLALASTSKNPHVI